MTNGKKQFKNIKQRYYVVGVVIWFILLEHGEKPQTEENPCPLK